MEGRVVRGEGRVVRGSAKMGWPEARKGGWLYRGRGDSGWSEGWLEGECSGMLREGMETREVGGGDKGEGGEKSKREGRGAPLKQAPHQLLPELLPPRSVWSGCCRNTI